MSHFRRLLHRPKGYRRAWVESKLWPDRLRRRLEAGTDRRWLRATKDYDKAGGEDVMRSWVGATEDGPWFETQMPGRAVMERTAGGWVIRTGRPELPSPDDHPSDLDMRTHIDPDDWTAR